MLKVMAVFLLALFIFVMIGLGLVLVIDRSRRDRRLRLIRFTANHPMQAGENAGWRLDLAAGEDRHDARARPKPGLIATRLREAGLEMSPRAAVLSMIALGAALLAALLVVDIFPVPVAGLVAAGAAYLSFMMVLGVLRSRRIATFNEALPDCLDVFARGLRSGQPVPAALGVVAHHASGVAQEEFSFCSEELRLGVNLPEAFIGIADRVGSPEARFIAVATSLQVETGGNLVETLENLANMLRERRKLRKKAAALSAEVRVSAFILSSLPFVVGGALWVMNGSYLEPLVSDPRGLTMLCAGIASLGLGIFSMYRLSRIDV